MRELLRARLGRLLLAVLLGVLSLGSALALAAISAWLITRAWQMPPVLDLTVAVVAVRALGISRGVLGYCQRLAAHDTALRSAADTRESLYRRLADAPTDTAMRMPSGELVARIASVDDLADVLVRAVLPIAVAAVLGVAAVVGVGLISLEAAVVLALCLVIAGVVAPALAARAAEATEEAATQYHSGRDVAVMRALEHAPELRVGGRLDDVLARAERRHREWGRATDRAAEPAAMAAAASTAAIGASVLGAVIAAIGIADSVAPTTLAVLMLLPLSAFEASAALPAAAVQLTRSRIAARRLSEITDPTASTRERPAVPEVSLAAGDRLAIVGPSGSGKTTLLLSIAERDPAAVFLAEDAHLFATTVRDNMLVARGDASDDEIRAALQRVGLGDWLDGLPDGLATVLTGGAAAVSAGQRRRLLLARALLCTAPTVLLDEPTEHLDAADSDRILVDLLTPGALFAADRTVVLATHHLPGQLECPTLILAGRGVTSSA